MFNGCFTVLVTPFHNGELDQKSLENLIEWQISQGTHGLVVCGTTGEASSLSFAEHIYTIAFVAEVTKKRIPVIAGTGSNCTAEAIVLTQEAERMGADAALIVTPYYVRPPQEGIFLHFKKIAKATSLPIILYNVPSRTGVNLEPETVARLAEIKNIVGIKESSGDMRQVKKIITSCHEDFAIYSGNDADNLKILELSGNGMLSVTANIIPRACAKLYEAAASRNFFQVREINDDMERLNHYLFRETNPIMVKYALSLMNKIKEEYRLPLIPASKENKDLLAKEMRTLKLI